MVEITVKKLRFQKNLVKNIVLSTVSYVFSVCRIEPENNIEII